MSTVGFRTAVHFSERRSNPMSVDIADRSMSDRFDSVASRYRYPSQDSLTPRSILKTSLDTTQQSQTDLSGGDPLQGMSDWVRWRTRVNDSLVDVIEERQRIFSYPGSIRHLRKYRGIMKNLVEPEYLIGKKASDCALQRAVYDHVTGRGICNLEPSTFIGFGLPRVHLKTNSAYNGDESRTRRDSGSTEPSTCTQTVSSNKSDASCRSSS